MANLTVSEAIPTWREELTDYLKQMFGFKELGDPYEILRNLSAFSARASYMRSLCVRSKNREVMNFRQDELDPFIKETELQFRIWSRVGALVKDSWEMSKG